MTQQGSRSVSDRLADKLRAFIDSLDPEEKEAMARFVSTPQGEEDVKGYGLDDAEVIPGTGRTIPNVDAVLTSWLVDATTFSAGFGDQVTGSITNPEGTSESAERFIE